MFCLAQGKENIMNLNGNYCLTTTSKRPLIAKRMVMCVCVYMIWNGDCLFVLLLPVKLLTITAFNRSFHNGTWNSPNMRHSFIFFLKRNFFFQNLILGYMIKTLNQIIFFFLHQNQNICFSNIGNQNIFLEKNHNPPFKSNGRSLKRI